MMDKFAVGDKVRDDLTGRIYTVYKVRVMKATGNVHYVLSDERGGGNRFKDYTRFKKV